MLRGKPFWKLTSSVRLWLEAWGVDKAEAEWLGTGASGASCQRTAKLSRGTQECVCIQEGHVHNSSRFGWRQLGDIKIRNNSKTNIFVQMKVATSTPEEREDSCNWRCFNETLHHMPIHLLSQKSKPGSVATSSRCTKGSQKPAGDILFERHLNWIASLPFNDDTEFFDTFSTVKEHTIPIGTQACSRPSKLRSGRTFGSSLRSSWLYTLFSIQWWWRGA